VKGDVQFMADPSRILDRLGAAARIGAFSFEVSRQKNQRHADDVVAPLLEECSGDAAIHPAAHSENDFLAHIRFTEGGAEIAEKKMNSGDFMASSGS
jgi:hypothetical protein